MDENNFDHIGLTEKQISEQFRTIDQLGRSGALAGVSNFQNAMATLYQYPDISGATRAIVETPQLLENAFHSIDLTFLDNFAVAHEALVENLVTTAISDAVNTMMSQMSTIMPNLLNACTNIASVSLTKTLELISNSQYLQILVNQLSGVLDRVSGDCLSNALDYLAKEESDFAFSEEEFSVSEAGGFILGDEEFSMNEVWDCLEKVMCKQDELLENDKKSQRESRLLCLVPLLLTIIFYIIPVDRLQELFDHEAIATKCFVTEHRSRLYAEANSSTSEIAILPEETELAIIEDGQRWYYVEYSDQDGNTLRGWIPKDNVEVE